MTRALGDRFVSAGGQLVELIVGALVATLALALLSHAVDGAQVLVSNALGFPILDRGDEWHPLSVLVLLLVPLSCGYAAARCVRRRQDVRSRA